MSAGRESLSFDSLLELLQDADPLVRVQAGFVLGAMGEDAEPAVPILIEMLCHGELQDRKLAATTLGEIGPIASAAVPILLDITEDDDDGLADLAAWALEEIDLADTDAEAA